MQENTKNKRVDAVLFDKDGTLLDFNGCWLNPYLQAAEYLAQSFGDPRLAGELMVQGGYIVASQTWVSDSVLASGSNQQILSLWQEIIGKPISEQQRQKIDTYFNLGGASLVPAIENIATFLADLKAKNLVLGVATMDDEQYAIEALAEMNLSQYFDFVCGADSGYGYKPDSGMVTAFCSQMEIDAGRVIMVGDSPRDIVMGNNAGVAYSVGVLTGTNSELDLEPYTDYVYNDITGITALLD